MARDKLGFEQDRRRDKQGRPLKIASQPASEEYRRNWERVFKKPRKEKRDGR